MAEWSNAPDSKSGVRFYRTVGSNPTLSASIIRLESAEQCLRDEATPDDFIEVDQDLITLSGEGMANPATRFHLWVYKARADVQ